MKSTIRAWRRIRQMKESQVISLVALSVGLGMALLLFLKAYHENSFNRSFKDSERIYLLETHYKQGNEEARSFGQVPGAIARAMDESIADVEAGTRITGLADKATLSDSLKNRYELSLSLADARFFDVLQQEILLGDPKKALGEPYHCMIPDQLVKKMGDDAMGKVLEVEQMPGVKLQVAGVYKSFPANSSFSNDVYVSMSSFDKNSYDNWLGNDRYKGYILLRKGANPSQVEKATADLLERNVDMSELKAAGAELEFKLKRLDSYIQENPVQKRLISILTIVACCLLLTTLVNYLLLRLSNILSRQKQFLLERSLGAARKNLWMGEFAETLLLVLIALLLATALLFALHKQIAYYIESNVADMLSPTIVTYALLALIVLLAALAYLPIQAILRLPLRAAISGGRASKSIWRRAFVGLEIAFAAFLTALLLVVILQYRGMMLTDQGYKHEELYAINISNEDADRLQSLVAEIRRKPWQDGATLSSMLPFESQSGDNLSDPVSKKELFNLCDFFDIDTAYFHTLQIPLIESIDSAKLLNETYQLYLSESAAKKLSEAMQWSDGVVGKEIMMSSYTRMPIIGVYSDVATVRKHIDLFPLKMPSAYVLNKGNRKYLRWLTVRIPSGALEQIASLEKLAREMLGNDELQVIDVSDRVYGNYEGQKRMRNIIWIGSSVALLMALIGLIAYISVELRRRKRELAIRKVLGAELKTLIWQMIGELKWIVLVATAIGSVLGYFIGRRWQAGFSYRAELPMFIFLAAIALLIGIVVATIALRVYLSQRHPAARDISNE